LPIKGAIMNPIEYGWRVTCAYPSCKRHVEMWSAKGYPSRATGGRYSGGPLTGWFIYYLSYYEVEHLKCPSGHIAYCPEHAAEATIWQAAFWDWIEQRRKVRKDVALPLLDRIHALIHPEEIGERMAALVARATKLWEKDHPMPQPPWKTRLEDKD
jgi:hypothetical protein